MNFFFLRRTRGACLLFLLSFNGSIFAPAQQHVTEFPHPEKVTYRIEWHSVNAGTAVAQLSKLPPENWQMDLTLQSAGLVTRLYRVADTYKAIATNRFCTLSTFMDAQEGKRHRQTLLTFQQPQRKVALYEHDFIQNTTARRTLDTVPCAHDIISALATLRTLKLEPGKTAMIPVTDGKKMVNVRIDAQAKENITIEGKTYSTVRYEAFLFDNVLYKRKGRLLIWQTEDDDRLPVQMRMQFGFPIGTVTVELERRENT